MVTKPRVWGWGSPQSPPMNPPLPNTPLSPPPQSAPSPHFPAPNPPAVPHIVQLWGLHPARTEREGYGCGSDKGAGLRSGAGHPGSVSMHWSRCRRAAGPYCAPYPPAIGEGRGGAAPYHPTLPHILRLWAPRPAPHRVPPHILQLWLSCVLPGAKEKVTSCESRPIKGLRSGAKTPGSGGGGQKWGRTPRLCLQSMLSGPQ